MRTTRKGMKERPIADRQKAFWPRDKNQQALKGSKEPNKP